MGVQKTGVERWKAALAVLLGRAALPVAAPPVEQTGAFVTRHAPDGRIRAAGQAGMTLLGRRPVELEGMTPRDLAHPDDLPALQALFREASYYGRGGCVQARLRHAAGHHVWTEISAIPARDDDGIVAVIRDISAWKKEEASLRAARDVAVAASHAKSRFLADMSHELRTPLNAIIGFSEVMEREMFGALGNARYREYAGLIQESGAHLLDLINGLLDMSKIEAGKFTLHEELFELDEAAGSALHFVQIAAERAGVRLKVETGGDARLAFADRRAVKQILVNLLSNAIKFTPSGGQVALCLARQGAGILITVTDNGMGIAPEHLARLGQPFEQGQAVGREGTGLGLSLVSALAALHGGSMEIDSRLGEGTRATVRLPQAGVDCRDPQAAAPPLAGVA